MSKISLSSPPRTLYSFFFILGIALTSTRGLHGLHCSISVHLLSMSQTGKISYLFRGGGSEKDYHEFPFLRDVELVERSLR